MAFLRLYTGDDGQSHFEEMDPLLPDTARSVAQSATSITFARPHDGRFTGWHNTERRQYVLFLAGGYIEDTLGDGTVRRLGPGDVLLSEDLSGQGHTAQIVGDCLIAIVPLAD